MVLGECFETVPAPTEPLTVGTAIKFAFDPGFALDHVVERRDHIVILRKSGIVENIGSRREWRLPTALARDIHDPFLGRLIPIEAEPAEDDAGKILEGSGNRLIGHGLAKAAGFRLSMPGDPLGQKRIRDAGGAHVVVGLAVTALVHLHHPGFDDAHYVSPLCV